MGVNESDFGLCVSVSVWESDGVEPVAVGLWDPLGEWVLPENVRVQDTELPVDDAVGSDGVSVGLRVPLHDGVGVRSEGVRVDPVTVGGLGVGERDRGVTVARDSVGVTDVGVRDAEGLSVGTGVGVRVVVSVDNVRVSENEGVNVPRNDPVPVGVRLVSVIEGEEAVGVQVGSDPVPELVRVPLKERVVVGVRVCVHVREHVCECETDTLRQREGERVADVLTECDEAVLESDTVDLDGLGDKSVSVSVEDRVAVVRVLDFVVAVVDQVSLAVDENDLVCSDHVGELVVNVLVGEWE